jgi:hypothetical protein
VPFFSVVRALGQDSQLAGLGNTDTNGFYTTTGLLTGTYYIMVGGSGAYAQEYYNDRRSMTSADPVNVTVPNITNGVDIALDKGGQITGRVTTADGGVIRFIAINVNDNVGQNVGFAPSVDANGFYTTTGLLSGNYNVHVNPYPYASCTYGNYAQEYYSDKATRATANLVSVTSGNTTPGIDFVLAGGSTVTGRVTDNGNGLSGVAITDADGRSVFTGANGYYTATALITGTYTVSASKAGYLFTPSSRIITVPPNATGQDFVTFVFTPTDFIYLPLITR